MRQRQRQRKRQPAGSIQYTVWSWKGRKQTAISNKFVLFSHPFIHSFVHSLCMYACVCLCVFWVSLLLNSFLIPRDLSTVCCLLVWIYFLSSKLKSKNEKLNIEHSIHPQDEGSRTTRNTEHKVKNVLRKWTNKKIQNTKICSFEFWRIMKIL